MDAKPRSRHILYSLSNYAGQIDTGALQLCPSDRRSFNYFLAQTNTSVGWCLENIVVTNVQQFVNSATNTTASTNLHLHAHVTRNNMIAAAPVLFTQFPLSWGPFKLVTAITNPNPAIVLGEPALNNNQVLLNFTVSGPASTFHLLETTQLNASWTTNTTATFTTNTPGSSYRYTATNSAPAKFYRVQTP